jgi:taurine-pyruvate aminotransferase
MAAASTRSSYRERDYHGTTLATLSAGGQPQRAEQYGPMAPGFVMVPHCLEYRNQYPDARKLWLAAADAIEEVILREGPDTVGGLCLEPITAGGGVITPPPGYWERVQEICAKYDILLHIDEVVCGVGRTGAWFGYQHYGIKPDFVTMAKGVASGYAAISCTVTTEACSSSSRTIRPILCPISATSRPSADARPARRPRSRTCDHRGRGPDRQHRSNGRADDHQSACTLQEKHAVIGDVRGKGLFLGAELVSDRASREPMDEKRVQAVVADCMAQGVIIGATNRRCPASTTRCASARR